MEQEFKSLVREFTPIHLVLPFLEGVDGKDSCAHIVSAGEITKTGHEGGISTLRDAIDTPRDIIYAVEDTINRDEDAIYTDEDVIDTLARYLNVKTRSTESKIRSTHPKTRSTKLRAQRRDIVARF